MSWKDKLKKTVGKVKREVKKPITKVKKEIKRGTDRLGDKVEKEIVRAKDKYDPKSAIEGLENMDTDILKEVVIAIWVQYAKKAAKESLDYTFEWFANEIRESKSKLDDFALPLLPSLKKLLRKLGE